MNELFYKVIFVIGYIIDVNRAPGSGKNTICDRMVDKYKFVHFSAGELLRTEV
jgi:adenylate kinase family enzyme